MSEAQATGPLIASLPRKAASISRADHRFYTIFAWLILASVFFGFARSYYLKEFFGTPPLAPVFHVHAVIFTTWLVFFVAQASLVSSRRISLHMTLGYAGLALAAAMVVVGFMAAVATSRSGHFLSKFAHDPIEAFYANMGDIFVFLMFLIPAYLLRRRPEAHKRLMLLATTAGLLPAAIARWPILHHNGILTSSTIFAFILTGPAYDLVARRRIHLAYILGFLLVLLTAPPARIALARTSVAHNLAAWIIR